MAPTSYQGPMKSDEESKKHYSQTTGSNLREGGTGSTVSTILSEKGGTVHSVSPETPVSNAISTLGEHKIGALLVMDADGAIRGILSERDIVRSLADNGPEALSGAVSSIMTADPVTCGPGERLIEMMRRMTEGRFRHLPVVEDGKLAGLISIGDVVKYRLVELEYEALKMKQMIVG